MRQFFWGLAFGAVAVYFYANYGDEMHRLRRYTLEWRDWAVSQSDGYSAGSDKRKK
jgi:hypothetical protein